MDSGHRYQGSFCPMCDHWATGSMSFSCLLGETDIFNPVFHGNLARGERPGSCARAGRLPVPQSRPQLRTFLEEQRRGICCYVNRGWCNDTKVILKSCSPHRELIAINFKPFYPPRVSLLIHPGQFLHRSADQRAGGTADSHRPDLECGGDLPGLPGYCPW